MNKSNFTQLAALLVLGVLSAETVMAQAPRPGVGVGVPQPGPTVSPYLNLLRGGNTPAINYYGLVRPQFQTNAGLQALQQQIFQAQGTPPPGATMAEDVFVTGTAAVFMNYGGYFQSPTGGLRTVRVNPMPTGPPSSASRLPRPGGR